MNEDRELLELAAFAAGMRVRRYIGNLVHLDNDGLDAGAWNPLDDDGDALRLANALGFNQYHVRSTAYVEDLDSGVEIREDHRDDINKATRRAIVRAAAEIGKQMKEQGK